MLLLLSAIAVHPCVSQYPLQAAMTPLPGFRAPVNENRNRAFGLFEIRALQKRTLRATRAFAVLLADAIFHPSLFIDQSICFYRGLPSSAFPKTSLPRCRRRRGGHKRPSNLVCHAP